MTQSPFFKEIPPGPIGPRPDENAIPAWFKAAWIIGIFLVFGAVAGGFFLLSGPDTKLGPDLFESDSENSEPDSQENVILANQSQTTRNALGEITNSRLEEARKSKVRVLTAEEVSVDRDAPAPGPWMEAHYRGLGHMERYEYDQAVAAFREVLKLQPDWPGSKINLAIARLNQTGTETEAAKTSRTGEAPKSNFDEALELLDSVIELHPGHLHAHYSRGIILEYVGRLAEAHRDFRVVAVKDPGDGYAWYKVGSTLTAPDDPNLPAGPDQASELIEIYERALACNPYLVPALYRLQMAYAMAGDRVAQKATIERWNKLNYKLNASAYGDTAETFYGEMGKYARIINPPDYLKQKAVNQPVKPAENPIFSTLQPMQVQLPDGCRWATPDDFSDPKHDRLRAVIQRFGTSLASADFNNDGKIDIYACASVVSPKGLRDALLINLGNGQFRDVSSEWGMPSDFLSTGVALADFDADRNVDILATGLRQYTLLRNQGEWFDDVTFLLGDAGIPALSLGARWLDLDQDGDLDLYIVEHTHADSRDILRNLPYPGQSNRIFRNDGVPPAVPGRPADNWAPIAVAPSDLPAKKGLSLAFSPWPDSAKLAGDNARHTGLLALDVDDDRDLDLVLTQDQEPASLALNDRQGKFTVVSLAGLAATVDTANNGGLVTDIDRDGRSDLVFPGQSGKVAILLNRVESGVGSTPDLKFEPVPIEPKMWSQVISVDLDLDGQMELVGLPRDHRSVPLPDWARYHDGKMMVQHLPVTTQMPEGTEPSGLLIADLDGSPLPDLLVWTETGPHLATNQTKDRPFLALDLGGRWKRSFDHMRTNPHGLGTRLSLEGQGLFVPYEHTTTSASLGQSVGSVVLGTAGSSTVPLLRLRWPDGVMQCELNVPADQKLALAENNRKTGSCPVLFCWNGERFVCLGDFLGGGGLGYLIAPGLYSQPDRDESMLIHANQLRAENGVFRMSITEPMDEVAYMDHLVLDVVDHPKTVQIGLDERFSPGGNRPTGELRFWSRRFDVQSATDLKNRDLTDVLKRFDRRTSDSFHRRIGWIGYAEEHGIVLHFGDQLKTLGANDRIVLGLAGWVEYPYSQTNFAAASSGLELKPPVLEIQNADGSWSVLESDPGYPAGLPRLTTLEMTGRLPRDRPVSLRLRTNMECYYDEAFLAVLESEPQTKVTSLPVSKAELGWRGYTREISPDGQLPLIYDYDYVDPAPLAPMKGRLTKYGNVIDLLTQDDDQFCIVGPGDEIRFEFDASQLPQLPEGWTRSYVLRSYGYCKDADPFTATSDDVGPLPYKGMPDYPFGPEQERPRTPAYQFWLDHYQTRKAGP